MTWTSSRFSQAHVFPKFSTPQIAFVVLRLFQEVSPRVAKHISVSWRKRQSIAADRSTIRHSVRHTFPPRSSPARISTPYLESTIGQENDIALHSSSYRGGSSRVSTIDAMPQIKYDKFSMQLFGQRKVSWPTLVGNGYINWKQRSPL